MFIAMPKVKIKKADGISMTLNQANKRNAISFEMWRDFPRAAELEADPDVRVIVLTGAGDKAFSAGADIPNLVNTAAHLNNVHSMPNTNMLRRLRSATPRNLLSQGSMALRRRRCGSRLRLRHSDSLRRSRFAIARPYRTWLPHRGCQPPGPKPRAPQRKGNPRVGALLHGRGSESDRLDQPRHYL